MFVFFKRHKHNWALKEKCYYMPYLKSISNGFCKIEIYGVYECLEENCNDMKIELIYSDYSDYFFLDKHVEKFNKECDNIFKEFPNMDSLSMAKIRYCDRIIK